MPSDNQAASQTLPPHVQLIQMATGGPWVAKTLYAAAVLGLADQLAGGPKSAAELAGPMRAHAPALHRLMRTLASIGILTERPEQRYSLTTLGEALRTGAPGSASATVLVFGSQWIEGAWGHMIHSVRTGKTGFEKAHGVPLFDYLAQHPEAASLFNETMVGFHGQEPPAVAAAYDFSTVNTVVDVGGGTGSMLAAILTRHNGIEWCAVRLAARGSRRTGFA
jgi:O-methyltransferase domain/Dimerisation domain